MNVTAKQTKSSLSPAPAGVSKSAYRAANSNAFPKSARLLKHASFQHVYENGRKHFSASIIFFYLLRTAPEGEKSPVQIGLTVGRALGGAVDRNRIKRRVRDLVRHELKTLQAALAGRGISAEVVINPKKSALTADIAKLREEVRRGFAVIAAVHIAGAAHAR